MYTEISVICHASHFFEKKKFFEIHASIGLLLGWGLRHKQDIQVKDAQYRLCHGDLKSNGITKTRGNPRERCDSEIK